MINIFNLFLVLLFSWLTIAFANNVLSWFYLFLGIIAAAVISLIAWKIKLINKNTNFLFLSLGFYKHFLQLFFFSFFKYMILLFKITFTKSALNPVIYYIPIKKHSNSELALFIVTISLTAGLFCIGIRDNEIIIHALDEQYFQKDKINQIYNNLRRINDNRLV